MLLIRIEVTCLIKAGNQLVGLARKASRGSGSSKFLKAATLSKHLALEYAR